MENSRLAAEISNKNKFNELCLDLDVPTVKSFACYSLDDFLGIQKSLPPTGSFIVKPMQDRMRLDDQRRRFSVCEGMESLEAAVSDMCRTLDAGDGFQVQEYVDFRKEPVQYYNVTFNISNSVTEYITTQQIINFSAIHHNIQSLHWGNRSATPHALLDDGEKYARKLAQHYFEIGYQGEIGIDFGLRRDSVFFLETNARVNNGTRLYYDLNGLGINPQKAHYIFIRDQLLTHAECEIEELASSRKIQIHRRPENRTLITSDSDLPIRLIAEKVDSVAQMSPPLAY